MGASLFAYTLWYYLPAGAAVKQLALSIFVQPVVGVAIGYFLGARRLG